MALLAACKLVASPSAAPPNEDVNALVQAMLVNDLSLRNMEWEQTVSVFTETLGWEVFRDGSFGEDEFGRWYWRGRSGRRSEQGKALAYDNVHYCLDAQQRMRTLNLDANVGSIRPYELERRLVPTPMMLMGRWIDLDGLRPLGEVLLGAEQIRMHPTSSAAYPVIEALLELDTLWTILVVTLDRAHGYCPKEIVRVNAVDNNVLERLTVAAFQEFQGMWIPIEGERRLYYPIDPGEDVRQAIIEEAARLGVGEKPDIRIDEVRERIHQAIRAVLGPEGYRVQLMGDGVYKLRVTGITRANDPVGITDKFSFPPDAVVHDAFTGQIKREPFGDSQP